VNVALDAGARRRVSAAKFGYVYNFKYAGRRILDWFAEIFGKVCDEKRFGQVLQESHTEIRWVVLNSMQPPIGKPRKLSEQVSQ
jgi:hypothetical protein